MSARLVAYFRAVPCWCGELICEARRTQPTLQRTLTRRYRLAHRRAENGHPEASA